MVPAATCLEWFLFSLIWKGSKYHNKNRKDKRLLLVFVWIKKSNKNTSGQSCSAPSSPELQSSVCVCVYVCQWSKFKNTSRQMALLPHADGSGAKTTLRHHNNSFMFNRQDVNKSKTCWWRRWSHAALTPSQHSGMAAVRSLSAEEEEEGAARPLLFSGTRSWWALTEGWRSAQRRCSLCLLRTAANNTLILSYVAPPPPHPSLTLAHVLQALDTWEWVALQTIGSEGCLPSLPLVSARVTPSAALISTTALVLMGCCLHLFFIDLVTLISLDRRSWFFCLEQIFSQRMQGHIIIQLIIKL